MKYIYINLKSFDYYFLEKSVKKIEKISFFLLRKHPKIIYLPKNIKRYTLLRSPHIDKKSREQFQSNTYKLQIFIDIKEYSNFSIFLFLLKHTIFPGIEMQISLRYNTFFKKKKNILY